MAGYCLPSLACTWCSSWWCVAGRVLHQTPRSNPTLKRDALTARPLAPRSAFLMQFSGNMLLIIGGALIGIIFLIAVVRARTKQTRKTTRPTSRGPASLQFTCAGCSQQFTHTKRTVAAWEKGTRRFFCNACHQKWRGSRPPQEAQVSAPVGSPGQVPQSVPVSPARKSATAGAFAKSSVQSRYSPAESRSGCLGVAVLFIVLPVIFLVATLA
jgi:hypothetical protein